MKRATPTPNRFITFTPNWWAKGFVLFVALFVLGSCLDETSLAGFKKKPRFEVKFKEFTIPATTVQADAIQSDNSTGSRTNDRLLCGIVDSNDPRFGKVTSTLFTQFLPTPNKIVKTGKTNFALVKLTFNLALDYYVYGDTLNSSSAFTLHQITGDGFSTPDKKYYTNSGLEYNLTPITSSAYDFKTVRFRSDSIRKYAAYNSDTKTTNDVYDTLSFDIPTHSILATALFDSAVNKKGIFTNRTINGKDTLVYNSFKTDSTFLANFKGFAVVPVNGNRVLGFKSLFSSLLGSSRLTLYYSYLEGGVQKIGKHNYFLQGMPSFSSILADRSGTSLEGQPALTLDGVSSYTSFDAPDNYCYVQAGTCLYTKLDFTGVRDFFDDITDPEGSTKGEVAINSAELVIPMESPSARPHIRAPQGLFLRMVQDNARFFMPPEIQLTGSDGKPAVDPQGNPIMGPDPQYANYYYSISNEGYLDARGDDADILNIALKTDDNGRYYRGHFTEFFEYHTRLPESISKINYLALVPSFTPFGKSLDGVSFKKDQIKFRVYYTQTE